MPARPIISLQGSKKCSRPYITVTVGFHDDRFGVRLDPGFTIYRTYKRREYRAQAIQGFWVLGETGKGYPTLNQLSNAIGAGKEDAWKSWFYDDPQTGRRRPVSDLRDQTKIERRKGATTLQDLGLA